MDHVTWSKILPYQYKKVGYYKLRLAGNYKLSQTIVSESRNGIVTNSRYFYELLIVPRKLEKIRVE